MALSLLWARVALPAPSATIEGQGHRLLSAARAFRLINEWRMEEAEEEVASLAKLRPREPDVLFLDAELRFLHGEYQAAAERAREAMAPDRAGDLGGELRELRDLAQATAEATHGFVETRSAHFTLRHAPGKDAVLVPYALDALERAYQELGKDFDDRPRQPVRVEIFPEVADLAKVSTLTLKEIETSGTIALCKFNRLMAVSPRALLHGYPWLDTLVHEYTHFIVSRASHNAVPIWLHEGLAKFEERRWRAGPGGGLTPSMEHLLASALARRHFISFEAMYPSMAKLPSQEDTALAFAEVYSAIEYLYGKVGWQGVRQVIERMRDGERDAAAVAGVVGRSFDEFQRDWRAWLRGRKLRAWPGLVPAQLRFKKNPGKADSPEDDPTELGEERARKLVRLGGLLRARHRLRAAVTEYEKAQALVGTGHPQLANRLARTYLELDDPDRAIAAAVPAVELYPDSAAASATLGAGYLRKGDFARARTHLETALRISPFDPAVHCGLERAYGELKDRRREQEAAACRNLRGE